MSASADAFDSRALRCLDCYGQRFMREGTYRYHVLARREQGLTNQDPCTIKVGARSGKGRNGEKMSQHTVRLRWKNGQFVVDTPALEIEVGDIVMWNCPDPSAPAYEIVGDQHFFSSARLVNECGFTHAFGTPGTYAWADAYGSALGGVVRVKEVSCVSRGDVTAWQQQLSKAALVMIADGKAQPAEIDIVAGQTVYFAIVTCKEISVTDRRLLGASHTGGGASGCGCT